MIYLSGCTGNRYEDAIIAAGVGLMVQPRSGYDRRIERFPYYAADNGCFGDTWVEDVHLAWLDARPRERCLFAVAPDVYPDAVATLERSARYFQLIRDMGFPVALVAQDHAETLDLPWNDFDCLFIGGERTPNPRHEWKLGPEAEGLARLARSHGKWVHMGRVNSLARMVRARAMGCHSADGTYVKYARRLRAGEDDESRLSRGPAEIQGWHEWLDANPELPLRPMEGPNLPVHRDALLARAAR